MILQHSYSRACDFWHCWVMCAYLNWIFFFFCLMVLRLWAKSSVQTFILKCCTYLSMFEIFLFHILVPLYNDLHSSQKALQWFLEHVCAHTAKRALGISGTIWVRQRVVSTGKHERQKKKTLSAEGPQAETPCCWERDQSGMTRLHWADRCGGQKNVLEHTTHQTLRWRCYSSRRSHSQLKFGQTDPAEDC